MVLSVSTTLDDLFGARAVAIIPGAITAAIADEIRERLAHRGYRRYTLVDRGRYEWIEDAGETDLVRALAKLAAGVTKRPLAADDVLEVRALRLTAGDYILAHHDRVHDDPRVELVLDVSAAAVPGAEVHYRRHGQVFHRVPSQPGVLSVVERDAAVTCHHTYVSKRHTTAELVRLMVRLRAPAELPADAEVVDEPTGDQ
jgi:hypothetical protein